MSVCEGKVKRDAQSKSGPAPSSPVGLFGLRRHNFHFIAQFS